MKMQRTGILSALVLCLSAGAMTVMGCELIASVERTRIQGEGGTSASASTGTGGGGGGAPACTDPAKDCPAPEAECVAAVCESNACSTENVSEGTEATTQTDGDCKKSVCDGKGVSLTENDDTDLPDDGNECTADACSEGNPDYTPVASGTECTQDGGKKCNAKGACVECLGNADCTAPETCKNEKCVPSTCSNAAKDGTETDVDCGGADCGPCSVNKKCLVGTDCQSGVCVGPPDMQKCAPDTCADGMKNGSETDVDCGGTACAKCEKGKACTANSDCASDVCTTEVCE